jgi:hypothetical protein
MSPYSTGDRVTHSQYGHGTVDSVNEYHTRITFDDHGLRTFVSSRVVLARSATPAPVKPASTRRRAKVLQPTT